MDGFEQKFAQGLNVLIGGRGARKSSVFEVIRCCLRATSYRDSGQQHSCEHALGVLGDGKVIITVNDSQQRLIVNVPVSDVECDEIWGFVGKKEKRVREDDDPNFGDAFTFVAIERNTKLVLNFALGKRNQATCNAFIEGLRHATSRKPFQVTTDGFRPYVSAIDGTLADRVDFAQLIKVYRASQEGEARYSPAEVASVEVVPVIGQPDPDRICTSIIERQNLTMRMQIRRLTRLTNGFSKKWENLWAALCLHFAYYNFCRVHRSLRVTPAMESALTDHIWTIAELLT